MPEETSQKGITAAASKFILKILRERRADGEDTSEISIIAIIDEHDLWMCDYWGHLGYCLTTLLENEKMVAGFKKGNAKILDVLVGKTIKSSNMTVDAELITEMIPTVISLYF